LIDRLQLLAPVIDYRLAPVATISDAHVAPASGFGASALDRLEPGETIDWGAARDLVASLVARDVSLTIGALLGVLDRFHTVDDFQLYWPIVNGLEARPEFARALVAHLSQHRSRNGLTLLLRQLARDVTSVDGVDVAELAARLLADT
jgi:hypothetical protein